MACCHQREERSVDRLFELVRLKELLDKYGDEIHFLQCHEQWGMINLPTTEAVALMLRDHPETSIFDKQV